MAGPLSTRVIQRQEVAEGVVDFRFEVLDPGALSFAPGQFVTLSVGQDDSGQPLRRSYSIASMPDDGGHLRLLIRLVPGGPGSAFFTDLQAGTTVNMTGPHGFFQLDDTHPGDLLFAVTGTGIAPVLPMLSALATDRRGARDISVYWGLRHASDRFELDTLARLCKSVDAKLHLYLSRPTESWTGLRGRITAPILLTVPGLLAPTFYLVGNGAMIQELKKGLVSLGINRRKQIRMEAFFD